MAVLRYNGPWDVRPLWGVDFPMGKSVVVDDPELVKKALRLDGFELVEADCVPIQPGSEDYPAVSEAEPLDVPVVGAGTIPEDWKKLHWKQRIKLAKDLSGMHDISTTEAADATIEALLKAN